MALAGQEIKKRAGCSGDAAIPDGAQDFGRYEAHVLIFGCGHLPICASGGGRRNGHRSTSAARNIGSIQKARPGSARAPAKSGTSTANCKVTSSANSLGMGHSQSV